MYSRFSFPCVTETIHKTDKRFSFVHGRELHGIGRRRQRAPEVASSGIHQQNVDPQEAALEDEARCHPRRAITGLCCLGEEEEVNNTAADLFFSSQFYFGVRKTRKQTLSKMTCTTLC